jgi:hypothetical protein
MARSSPTHGFSLFLFLASVCVQTSFAQEANSAITGRVTDSTGQPVANASVSYSVAHSADSAEGLDGLVLESETAVDGRFRFSLTVDSNERFRLYVTTPVPATADAPLRPPFLDLTGKCLFRGIPIEVKANSVANAGDIPIEVYYKTLKVHLSNASDMGPLELFDKRAPWLRVRDAHGDVVALQGVVQKAINRDESSVFLALPQGVWGLEFALRGSDGPWNALSEPVHIDPSAHDLYVSLKVGSESKDEGQHISRNAATAQGHQDARRRLAELGIQVDESSFIQHAGTCNREAVDLLLSTGINPNVRGSGGDTALITASAKGCGDVVKSLLEAGADPNISNDAGTSPLIAAAISGSLSAVEMLLARNADPNARDKESLTPLIGASGNGNLKILKALLRANADVNTKDNKGKTALDYALGTSDHNVIEALRTVGAKSGMQ